jgi:hypothetical protein
MVRSKAHTRSFEPEQEVLALLPLPGNLLQAKYYGTYHILEKLAPVDYLIETPNHRKLEQVCHVNLLRPYHHRDKKRFPHLPLPIPVCVAMMQTEDDFGSSIPALEDLTKISDAEIQLSHLASLQATVLNGLLKSYSDIFSDFFPSQTSLYYHNIELLLDRSQTVAHHIG